jgi:hypothetical protein
MPKHKAKPKVPKRPAVTHGGKKIEIPLLSGPVGPKVAELKTKYLKWNDPTDVETVSYYFSVLADAEVINQEDGKRAAGAGSLQKAADAAKEWQTSLHQAIADFQTAFGVSDPVESKHHVILPDGETLKTLVDYGDDAEKLLTMSWAAKNPHNYMFIGHFDIDKFITAYNKAFAKDRRYDPAKEPHLRQLLGFLMKDPRMIDIRWVAYVITTAYWEVTSLEKIDTGKVNKKKKPIFVKAWRAQWFPVEEVGHGGQRSYVRPVKVKKLADGTGQVTEWDGDQFSVGLDGKYKALTKHAIRGAKFSHKAAKAYEDDDGAEHAYFGRGYVQLAWWNNYASAGVNIGRGLDLLFDPELALDPETSYTVMSYSLLTGKGFANNHKLSDYFYGATANYAGARHMVNGTSHAEEIAKVARKFEALLLEARI